jgi:pimeloyl-ACP methyl ester carboxylesterase
MLGRYEDAGVLPQDRKDGSNAMIEDTRGNIDYDDEGTGPAIVFVPGSWGTRSAWRDVIEGLRGRFRIITTSLLGDGGTKERRTATHASIESEAELSRRSLSALAPRCTSSVTHSAAKCVLR